MVGKKEFQWMVSVRCMTYNQKAYIQDALDGFCIQKTSFPFVCCIMDDASTDGEPEVLMNYLEKHFDISDKNTLAREETNDYKMLFVRHKENHNCFFAVFFLKYNHYASNELRMRKLEYIERFEDGCNYIAMCEGDDYWTDSQKLQKQISILEERPEYTLVHSAFNYVNTHKELIPPPEKLYMDLQTRRKEGYLWNDQLVLGITILFCTCVYRKGIIDKSMPSIDYAQFMSCARKGKIAFIDSVTAAYRIQPQSMMRSNRDRVNLLIKQAIFYQLFFFSSRTYETDVFYKRDLRTRIYISEAIISTMFVWNKLKVEGKYKKLFYILFARPLNTLLLPVALVSKVLRRVS